MALKAEYKGDALKAPGAMLAVSRNKETDKVNGLYVLSEDGIFIRGNRTWITATGPALHAVNGSQLIEMEPRFVDTFDDLDARGNVPSEKTIAAGSTKGGPASWDTQAAKTAKPKK